MGNFEITLQRSRKNDGLQRANFGKTQKKKKVFSKNLRNYFAKRFRKFLGP